MQFNIYKLKKSEIQKRNLIQMLNNLRSNRIQEKNLMKILYQNIKYK